MEGYKVRISMDGHGRCRDNARMERFWRSLKYEDRLIRCYETMRDFKSGVDRSIHFYNYERLHSALKYQPPVSLYEFSGRRYAVAYLENAPVGERDLIFQKTVVSYIHCHQESTEKLSKIRGKPNFLQNQEQQNERLFQ